MWSHCFVLPSLVFRMLHCLQSCLLMLIVTWITCDGKHYINIASGMWPGDSDLGLETSLDTENCSFGLGMLCLGLGLHLTLCLDSV